MVPWLLWAPSPRMKVTEKQPQAARTTELWLVIQSVREGHNVIKEFGGTLF